MHKYMELRPEKQNKKGKGIEDMNTGADDSEDDPELEKFANDEMDRQMRRMASGAPGGMPDSEDEEISLDENEIMGSDEDLNNDDGDEEGEEDDGGFFSGEDDL